MIGTAIDTKLPRLHGALPGPKAKEIVALDERHISPSYTRSYPLVAKRGQGAMIEDVDGNVFLDFAAGIAVVSTGHCHPKVVEAIQRQAAELIHISGTDFYYSQMIELAEKLEKVTPGKEPKRVFYANSGTEAVEAAIKLARYATGREKLIAFQGCFHGRTMGSLSLTASKAVQRKGFGSLLSGVFHIPYPNQYRCPFGGGAHDCGDDVIEHLEKVVFKKLADPSDVAAIFVEPVQGEGGYVPAPPKFLRDLANICARHGILLVADEVQSGMGRTGKWWASEYAGIEPDIMCLSKGITGGFLPLGATVCTRSVREVFRSHDRMRTFFHGHSYTGSPLACAAGIASLKIFGSEPVFERIAAIGKIHAERLPALKKHPAVGDVRSIGTVAAIEIKTGDAGYLSKLRPFLYGFFLEKGVLLRPLGNIIYVLPPYVITASELHYVYDVIQEALNALPALQTGRGGAS